MAKVLAPIQKNLPLFAGLTSLQTREFMLESRLILPKEGEVIFHRNDYTDSFFSILDGEAHVEVDTTDPARRIPLPQGAFFGEMSLISGHRCSAMVVAGKDCVLIETPRRSMNKLINPTVQ